VLLRFQKINFVYSAARKLFTMHSFIDYARKPDKYIIVCTDGRCPCDNI
jgi:hypothetical protein